MIDKQRKFSTKEKKYSHSLMEFTKSGGIKQSHLTKVITSVLCVLKINA